MAERYRFFNSSVDDPREYNASEFAEYFSLFLTNGVYTENGQAGLKVSAGTGRNINIATGYAFIDGYMYQNDSVLTKTIDAADATLDRIDRIIIKFDEFNRRIGIEVKKGSLASSPSPPSLTNTSSLKELSLAQVRVRKGTSTILSSDITDERLTEYCGIVSSLIDIPIDEMWNAWNSSLDDIQQMWNTWYQNATSGVIDPALIQQNATHRFITDILLDKLAGIEAGANKYTHPGGTNPHGTTKSDVGLSNVVNKNLDNVDNVKQMPIAGGNFAGITKAQANTSYTTAQLRNTILSSGDPSGGSNGDVWIKYK